MQINTILVPGLFGRSNPAKKRGRALTVDVGGEYRWRDGLDRSASRAGLSCSFVGLRLVPTDASFIIRR